MFCTSPTPESTTISGLVIGIIAFCCSQFIFIPQFIRLIKTKNTSGISLFAYIAYALGYTFWSISSLGLYFNQLHSADESISLELYQASITPVTITNTASAVLMSITMAVKIRHVILAKRLHVTELQLSEILLNKQKKMLIGSKQKIFFRKYWSLFVVALVDLTIILTLSLCLSLLTEASVGSTDQWTWVAVFNCMGAVSAEAMCWTQFIKSLRTRDTSGLSLFWAVFIPCSGIMFFTYNLYLGFANGKFYWPMICSLVLNGFIPNIGVLVLKIINLVRAKRLGLTEIQYTKQRAQNKKLGK